MSASIFIARLLGPMFTIIAAALISKEQTFRTILQDFIRSPALVYLAGFLGLLSGLALVLTHNIWVSDWRVIITLIGWVTIVRAVVTIFAPHQIAALGSKLLGYRGIFRGAAAVNLVIGVVLSYFGYVA